MAVHTIRGGTPHYPIEPTRNRFRSEPEKVAAVALSFFCAIASVAVLFSPFNYVAGTFFLMCGLAAASLPVRRSIRDTDEAARRAGVATGYISSSSSGSDESSPLQRPDPIERASYRQSSGVDGRARPPYAQAGTRHRLPLSTRPERWTRTTSIGLHARPGDRPQHSSSARVAPPPPPAFHIQAGTLHTTHPAVSLPMGSGSASAHVAPPPPPAFPGRCGISHAARSVAPPPPPAAPFGRPSFPSDLQGPSGTTPPPRLERVRSASIGDPAPRTQPGQRVAVGSGQASTRLSIRAPQRIYDEGSVQRLQPGHRVAVGSGTTTRITE